jgi:hypothetical protein
MLMVGEFSPPPTDGAGLLCQSEIEHLYHAIRLEHDVAGFQIAMGDAFLVSCLQRVTYLPCDTQGVVER